ncbi:MAG: bifunctional 4-hydroxy-2-oxoglutarate aldolase/2-dehydro-3-deoxy-phosphogluconate aldolase [Burkholderiales bacterium]|nr:bifunctional 4-hydroxy-2-oxoglutarate aldolase/2-dehydro-3-deoxy-phosphogluconate aldolase [Burkholderiales bacterium]
MSTDASSSHMAPTILQRLQQACVIPVLRLPQRETATRAIDLLLEAGFSTIELTLTTPGAIDLLTTLRARAAADFLVGAGTVLDLDTARACLDAGADYLVSPCLVPGLAPLTMARGCAALIGGFTPGEVLAAWRDGATAVKVFPASSGGPSHLAGMHAVFPEIPLCPTGGVSLTNMSDYFKAGAAFVGVGNNVIDQAALAAGDDAAVVRHARSFLTLAAAR